MCICFYFQMGPTTSYETKLSNLGKIVLRRHVTRQSLNGSIASNITTNTTAPVTTAANGTDNNNMDKERKREIRTTLILFVTVILYLLCWIPGVFVLSFLLYDPYSITVYGMVASYIMTHFNSVIDPFLYAFNIRGVDKAAKRLLKRMLCMKIEPESNQNSSGTGQVSSRSSSRQSINKAISFT